MEENLALSNGTIVEAEQLKVKDYFSLSKLDESDLIKKCIKAIVIDKHRYDLSSYDNEDLQKIINEISSKMLGATAVVTTNNEVVGIITDGDLRRMITQGGRDVLSKKLGDFEYKTPISIESGLLLNEAAGLFKKTNVDTILVTEGGKPVGMLDIQDMKGE